MGLSEARSSVAKGKIITQTSFRKEPKYFVTETTNIGCYKLLDMDSADDPCKDKFYYASLCSQRATQV